MTGIETISKVTSMKVSVFLNATLSNANYQSVSPLSGAEYDTQGTLVSEGVLINEFLVSTDDLSDRSFEENIDYSLSLHADGVTPRSVTFAAKPIDPTQSGSIVMTARWREEG